jgi:DNA-binding CsgD family transcriptional regulator
MSRIGLVAGDHQRAAAALQEILDSVGLGEAVAQQILAEYLTLCRFTVPLLPELKRRLAPIVEAARRGAPPADCALLAHVTLDLAMQGDSPRTVRALAERASATDPLVDPGSHGMPMGILVQALCCVDEIAVAERIADRALAAALKRGSFFAASIASYHRAIPRYHRGALVDALADLDQALAPSREGWSGGAVWSQALTAHAHLERGELRAAAEMLGQVSTRPESMDVPIALFARARLALADRDPLAAFDNALAAGRVLGEQFGIDHPGFVPWRLTATLAAVALGEQRRARELADEQLELARTLGVPRALAIALRTAAAVADERGRIELLSDAAAALKDSASMLERAHVLASLGGALRRAGHRADAQAPLREAMQLADRMGAAPLADAARDELRATGARPRRAAFTGADALTPSELRVAQFAAQGLTNAEIAQDLFVTTKTVQTHLAHAYRKLNIASRRELAAALGEPPSA